MRKPKRFRVYPYPGTRDTWYDVWLVQDHNAVVDIWNDLQRKTKQKDDGIEPVAFCNSFNMNWHSKKKSKKKGCCGYMVFPRGLQKGDSGLTFEETIAHECTHAAMGIVRALGIPKLLASKNDEHQSYAEEQLCYRVGQMTAQVIKGFKKYS